MRLLDLYCGAGGAGEGYRRAGFCVTGVDNKSQPRYSAGEFVHCDAIEYLRRYGHMYDVIHASPPCQFYSRTRAIHGREKYDDSLPDIQRIIQSFGKPYVIENVPGAPIVRSILLCGTMFPELRVIRHRIFECNFSVAALPHDKAHKGIIVFPEGVQWSSFAKGATHISVAGRAFCVDDAKTAMGINWMTKKELSQAIPPAYTEYIGKELIKNV